MLHTQNEDGLTEQTITDIIMLYKNKKVTIRFTDANTTFFNIATKVLLGDIFAPYIYIYIYIRVQILDETDWISYSPNTLGKGINPIILSPQLWVNSRAD